MQNLIRICFRLLIIFICQFSFNAKAVGDTIPYFYRMVQEYIAANVRTSDRWEYVSGLELLGFERLWELTGNEKYYTIIRNSVDYVVSSQGIISGYKTTDYNLDQINEGRILLFLYTQTGEIKYKIASDSLRKQLENHPRTTEGGFWHKLIYPSQMWLDGIYMGEPFYMEYSQLFNQPGKFNDVVNQITLIEKHTRDSVTGLLYHGWDESKKQKWADSITGRSPNFWGRAMGWYAMALVDVLDNLPDTLKGRADVIAVLQRLAEAVTNVQDSSTGLWYQVLDKGGQQDNYVEGTVSCMLVYALAKAVKKGYIDSKYKVVAEKGYKGINDHLVKIYSGKVYIDPVCYGAGLGGTPYRDGSYDYYVHQAMKGPDNKDMILGSFILAGLQIEPDSVIKIIDGIREAHSNKTNMEVLYYGSNVKILLTQFENTANKNATISIYNILGKEIQTVVTRNLIGSQTITIHLTNDPAPGIYIIVYRTQQYALTKKFEIK